MRKVLDGLGISSCVQCGSGPEECWYGCSSGYGSCAACHKNGLEDCGVCLYPEYRAYAARDGRAPYFGVRGTVLVTGQLVDFRSRRPAPNKPLMLGFPNGIAFHAKSDRSGRFAIRVDSTEGGRPERIDLGALRHRPSRKPFFIGFALTSKAGRDERRRRRSAARAGK
jgi:hypothetical protein